MKVRNGFVSNSSSSSFVCFVCVGVRFKADDSKLYQDERDEFWKTIDDVSAYHDSEGEGNWVYHGALKQMSDDDYDFERVRQFDEMTKEGLENAQKRLIREVKKMFQVPPRKVEFGMWSGRVAS